MYKRQVLSFGADSDTTLTHTDGSGLTINSTNKLMFRDSALSVSSSADGQLDIDADTEVEITATSRAFHQIGIKKVSVSASFEHIETGLKQVENTGTDNWFNLLNSSEWQIVDTVFSNSQLLIDSLLNPYLSALSLNLIGGSIIGSKDNTNVPQCIPSTFLLFKSLPILRASSGLV